jgi:endonuclease I
MVDAIARMVTDLSLRQRISAYNHAHPPLQDWDHVVAVADLEYARAARILGRVTA